MANENKQAQGNDKPKKRGRVKETFAELKKVTWPTFGKTMKQTGSVFVVTIFFLVILLAMDQLLGVAHKQLIKGLTETVIGLPKMLSAGFESVMNTLFSGARALPLLI